MRKRITGTAPGGSPPAASRWLDVDRHAQVEVTSEDTGHPVESALRPGGGSGWRAGEPGEQTIQLRFDEPRRIERVRLVFEERDAARTQEFVLRWSADGGITYRDVVRQQYTFSPPGTTREVEDYAVELDGVTALELHIVPDIARGSAPASLSEWTLA
jgi:F5/8 type C domain